MGFNDTRLASLAAGASADQLGLGHFLARTPEQRDAIYKLRYNAYFNEGLVPENPEGRLRDEFDTAPDSAIFGVTLNGSLVSTIRLSLLRKDRKSSATYAAFGDYLDQLLDSDETVADGSRLAVCCDNSSARRSIILYTLRLAALYSASFSAHHGAISVRESHALFYQRYGFRVLSEPRPYNGMVTPLSLMMITLRGDENISQSACA